MAGPPAWRAPELRRLQTEEFLLPPRAAGEQAPASVRQWREVPASARRPCPLQVLVLVSAALRLEPPPRARHGAAPRVDPLATAPARLPPAPLPGSPSVRARRRRRA